MKNLPTVLLLVWILWIIWVSLAIYFKWTKKKNRVFYSLYIGLIISFGIISYNLDPMQEPQSPHPGALSYNAITVLKHFIITLAFTSFLQLAVWWFTRKWHRQ